MLPDGTFQFAFFAMGSPCSLCLYAKAQDMAKEIADAAIEEVRRIERKYSRYLGDSLLSGINRVARTGGDIAVDPETAILFDIAFRAHERSDGLFDISSGRMRQIWNDAIEAIPDDADIVALLGLVGLGKISWQPPQLSFAVAGMELDLGGIAKEYAADRAAEICRAKGSQHGFVNLGGDIAVIGAHPDGAPWRIGIRDPFGSDGAIATLFIDGGGIATSGDYERYWSVEGRRFGHLIDPRTGWPVQGLPSVTVAADTCLAAGMVSTIAVLKGQAGPKWLRESGAAHLYVETTGALGGSILLDQSLTGL
ncbi:FAD:protein FMN transferase [Methylovirgula sp. HY1]|uniref:FAD:protein FMN transferase n=1 Tax=Methylovirgula sp. HY1 TaxID=2822761 RepID=UPI001C5BF5BE|nr:FAD:protein FMN transferase [Methylovirgula sp. HY1]